MCGAPPQTAAWRPASSGRPTPKYLAGLDERLRHQLAHADDGALELVAVLQALVGEHLDEGGSACAVKTVWSMSHVTSAAIRQLSSAFPKTSNLRVLLGADPPMLSAAIRVGFTYVSGNDALY